jgi:hypothetical protein
MLRVAGITVLLLLLAGCADVNGPTVYAPRLGGPVANLVLGPAPDYTALAETYAYRSSWPSARLGYVFDDVATYTELIYDDQSYYDARNGGGYTREAVSVRTGVWIR